MKQLLIVVALIAQTFRPDGSWTDVGKAPDGTIWWSYATSHEIYTVKPDGAVVWHVPIPEPILYLRIAVNPDTGEVRGIGQGNQTGNAYSVGADGIKILGTSFGQNATAVGWFRGAGFTYYVQQSPTSYNVYNDAGCAPCSVTMKPTSQGFRDITPNGEVIFADDAFTRVVGGRQLWEPMTRDDVTVGQGDPAGIYVSVSGGTPFTAIPGDGFEPHVVVTAIGFGVVARTSRGAALAVFAPPYPSPAAPGPVDPKKPADPVQSVPDESATVKAVAAQNPDLLARLRSFAKDCHTDADPACAQVSVLKGEMTRRIAWAVYQHDHRWGLRLKTGGTNTIRPADGKPLSTDVLMWDDGTPDLPVVDVMSDTNAGWGGQRPGDTQPRDQWVQPLPEGDVPPPPPPPPPGPDPRDAMIAALQQRIASLEEEVAVLNGQAQTGQDLIDNLRIQVAQKQTEIDALKNRPAPSCEAKVPAALKSLGIKIGCRILP